MRIAMIGQKGIPATYGGIERHVEELAKRLVQRGHAVTVYTRPHYVSDRRKAARRGEPRVTYYAGVRIVRLPSLATKHLDAISHVALCTAHAALGRADVIHYHAVGPALFSWVPRLFRKKAVATIHGQDALRPKWGGLASAMLRLGEWMAVKAPAATICVSETLTAKLNERHGSRIEFVPNGVTLIEDSDDSILDELGLEPERYILFASRLVPEKGCHYLIEAWRKAGKPLPLVMAGDSSFTPEYVEQIKGMPGGEDVMFPGYVYGPRLASLFRNASLFVLPSDLEGLAIVLLESLGYGVPVLASDIPPNVEVLGKLGRLFAAGDVEDLRLRLEQCLGEIDRLKATAAETADLISAGYNWDIVTRKTIAVYHMALRHPAAERL